MEKKVFILGAGVSGMTTALAFQELGYSVTVGAKNFSPHTTSDVAPAIWYPEKIEPIDKTRRWAVATYRKFLTLSQDPKTGVCLRQGRKYFHRPMGDPWWKEEVLDFRRLRKEECGTAVCGYEFTGFVIDMSIYLKLYLYETAKRQGAEFLPVGASHFYSLFEKYDLVVNCTGLSSRELVPDTELVPKRGQLVRVSKIPNQDFLLDTDHPEGMVYVVPRMNDCVLGTVSEEGRENLEVEPLTSQKILERCALYVPEVKKATVLEEVVGLRPARSSVRVETEVVRPGKTLMHNYGHGGNGVTLSWGCAFEVAGVKMTKE